MKLYFKQRFFSWFDSYDIFYEDGSVAYTVKGKLSWGHKLVIYDMAGRECGLVKQKVLTFLPKLELYINGGYMGCIRRRFSFIHPKYEIDFNGWKVIGNFLEWNYTITDARGYVVAAVDKELFHLTDHYAIDVANPSDALPALMFTLAIDAEKCSRG